MTKVRKAVQLLAGQLDVSIAGLDDDAIEVLANLVLMVDDDEMTATTLRAIVADVREAVADLGQRRHRKMHYLATEATMGAYRQRLALAERHSREDGRSGLYLVPRRPQAFPAGKPHPACLAAARDGGTPCSRCLWLLDDDPYTDAWMDRDD